MHIHWYYYGRLISLLGLLIFVLCSRPEPVEGLKIRGVASSNVVGIICPMVGIGLTDLEQSWEGKYPTPTPLTLGSPGSGQHSTNA